MAPCGPERTISSISAVLASSASGDDRASGDTIMSSSLQRRGAQRVGLADRNRSPVIAPGYPDIGHDRRDFVVRKRLGERRLIGRLSQSLVAVTAGALVGVDGLA